MSFLKLIVGLIPVTVYTHVGVSQIMWVSKESNLKLLPY